MVKYPRCDELSPRVPRPASSPPPAGGGLSYADLQAALHPRSALPPPRRVGLRFPTPVGHGRGLAARPGCAVRGKASIPPGVVSTGSGAAVRRDLPGFASACFHPCPENGPFQMFLPISSASTGPAAFRADPDHASAIRNSNKLQKEAATAPESSGGGRCRCGATNCSAKLPADASAITSSYVM